MTASKLEALKVNSTTFIEEEFSIPLNLSEIIDICREFNKLGFQIQSQVENILDVGIEESIKNGSVKKNSLPHIKNFLQTIVKNQYFGDAAFQANDCINLIEHYEFKNKIEFCSTELN